ncbi:MAG: response regulator [Sneathiella sp.]|nr:response regulator [Sneathiella sp.]
MDYKEIKIVLVEDDFVDVLATKKALQELRIQNPIFEARDGLEALDFLRGDNGVEKIDPPYIILLDLNMPRMGGLEFLETIRADSELKSSIIFVMTTSEAETDVFAAYEQNIAGYIVKTNTKHSFIDAIGMLKHYWTIVEMPTSQS